MHLRNLDLAIPVRQAGTHQTVTSGDARIALEDIMRTKTHLRVALPVCLDVTEQKRSHHRPIFATHVHEGGRGKFSCEKPFYLYKK